MTNIRSNKLLKGAEGQACVNCNKNDGTTVAAHYQGFRAQSFGKGTGIKPHDLCIADLCHECHTEFDSGEGSFVKDKFQRQIDLSERFATCILKTLFRRVKQGILKTDDIKF